MIAVASGLVCQLLKSVEHAVRVIDDLSETSLGMDMSPGRSIELEVGRRAIRLICC